MSELCSDRELAIDELAEWTPASRNFWWRPSGATYFNAQVLRPGDLLLFRPPQPRWNVISAFQRQQGVAAQAAAYRHAAIYLDLDHLICEAVREGVRITDLEREMREKCLLVRRLADLRPGEGELIAQVAAGYRATQYDLGMLLNSGMRELLNKPRGSSYQPLVCSTLYARAVLEATQGRVSLVKERGKLVSPGVLAETPLLQTVAGLEWRRVPEEFRAAIRQSV